MRWLDTAEATQITRVDKAPSTFKWSPDGKTIAFVMRTPADDGWKIDMPKAPEGAKWTEEPRVIEGVYFRQDRRGFMEEGYLHLFTVDAGGGTPRQLTKGTWNVGARTIGLDYGIGIDWTPDSKTIVFDGLMEDDDPAMPYRRSHLYAVDVATTEIRRLTFHEGPWTGPVVSPDGKLRGVHRFPVDRPDLPCRRALRHRHRRQRPAVVDPEARPQPRAAPLGARRQRPLLHRRRSGDLERPLRPAQGQGAAA